jgi:hypothetical protein
MSYSELPSEGAVVSSTRPAPAWPQYGIVTFEGYTMIGDDGSRQLKNLWGCIRAEEKVNGDHAIRGELEYKLAKTLTM